MFDFSIGSGATIRLALGVGGGEWGEIHMNQHEFYSKVDPERLEKEKRYIHDHRNEMKRCPYCNGNIEDRVVSLYAELVASLLAVYRWCGEHKVHEFERKDIKHLLKTNEYARFGDFVRFGGLVYKKDGKYGLNMERCKQFFNGEYTIPMQIILNQITNEIVASTYKKVSEFKGLGELLDSHGMYDYKKVIATVPDKNKNDLPSVEEYQRSLFSDQEVLSEQIVK